jgi:DNA-binding response OmpR family regulator
MFWFSSVRAGPTCNDHGVHVLLVEDDQAIFEPLIRGLQRDGLLVDHVTLGRQAILRLNEPPVPEVIILDLGLPDIDGYDVCRQIREQSDVPIIILTARGDETNRVLGLELGADDYMVKPFGLRELVARIGAVTRRSARPDDANQTAMELAPGLMLDLRSRQVTRDGHSIDLTRKEFDLLALLASDRGAIHRRADILEQVWDTHWYGPTKTLDVHIAGLRRKLGDHQLIETVRGVGFRMRAEP